VELALEPFRFRMGAVVRYIAIPASPTALGRRCLVRTMFERSEESHINRTDGQLQPALEYQLFLSK